MMNSIAKIYNTLAFCTGHVVLVGAIAAGAFVAGMFFADKLFSAGKENVMDLDDEFDDLKVGLEQAAPDKMEPAEDDEDASVSQEDSAVNADANEADIEPDTAETVAEEDV